jgi:hypothetical protein
MAYINNMLPGSRRSVPYFVDTSEGRQSFYQDMVLQMSSHPLLENDRTKQGMGVAILTCAWCQAQATFQTFRSYLLEQEKSMDILAYLLCQFLEVKDKPGNELSSNACLSVLIQCHRTTRVLSSVVLHRSDALS